MTDWSKLKVVELKEECKARDIPLTGLKLKQQYIDKLEEYEAASTAETGGADAQAPSDDTDQKDPSPSLPNEDQVEEIATNESAEEAARDATTVEQKQEANKSAPPEDKKEAHSAQLPTNLGGAPSAPEATDAAATVEEPTERAADETSNKIRNNVAEIASSEPLAPTGQPRQITPDPAAGIAPATASAGISEVSTPASSQIPLGEVAEDQRKRKRRSVTPVPTVEEIARKKARANDGTPVVAERDPSTIEPAHNMEAQPNAGAEANNSEVDQSIKSQLVSDPIAAVDAKADSAGVRHQKQSLPKPSTEDSPLQEHPKSRSPSVLEERPVAPALHPATSSLYIRNFKRPLHIPTLRAHVASLARPKSNEDVSDPIKTFYLDSIRTHAFISFRSVKEASRVRIAMHETRFPDEAMREPLFVDFIPDDKVQGWIDLETGAGGGGGGFGRGGGGGKRYEVTYSDRSGGMEAILQDVDSSRERPQHLPQRSIRLPPEGPAVPTAPASVHPDRAAFVPRNDRKPSIPDPPAGPRGSAGTGFKALDELFSSTTIKPKLYYKSVPPAVAEDRLDMSRDLLVGHADRGRSGDEGMKRYTFESYRGRDEWVDKGPEFGFGRKGQDRLAGFRGRGGGGGYRGGGRGGRGRGEGDSWRGR